MSTNFYFTPTKGPLVAFGQLHLGKHNGGAQFSFQAYVEEGGKRRIKLDTADLSLEIDIPRLVIKSWSDWKALLRSTPGLIENEYGTPYTVEKFEKEISYWAPGVPDLRSPYDTLVAGEAQWGKVDPERNWKDAEGFSFSNYEFF